MINYLRLFANLNGWTALPGGYRNNNGISEDISGYGTLWRSIGDGASNAWYRTLSYDLGSVDKSSIHKHFGFLHGVSRIKSSALLIFLS